MVLSVIIVHLLLYRTHSLLIKSVFLFNLFESMSEMPQRRMIFFILFDAWWGHVIINFDDWWMPTSSGREPFTSITNLRICVNHLILRVTNIGDLTFLPMMFNWREFPSSHPLVHVFFELFLRTFSISGNWETIITYWFLISNLSELDFMYFSQKLFFFSL